MSTKGTATEAAEARHDAIQHAPQATVPEASVERERAALIDEIAVQLSPRGLKKRRRRRAAAGLAWAITVQILAGLKRFFDILMALASVVLATPLFVLAGLASLLGGGPVLQRREALGRWCIPFQRFQFGIETGFLGKLLQRPSFRDWPSLLNVLRGEMSLVGPRCLEADQYQGRERAARMRMNVRPGIVCLSWVRKRANNHFESEFDLDVEYAERADLRTDVGILLRAVPAILYGSGVNTTPDVIRVLGVRIDNVTMTTALDSILDRIRTRRRTRVSFLNADCCNIACRDASYRKVLRQSDLCFADGIGLKLAGRLLGRDIRQNVNGTDLFPRLCEVLKATPHRMFLLGAAPGVVESVQEWVEEHHPGVQISGSQHGYFEESELAGILERIRASNSDVLLVALGAPHQEMWLAKHLEASGATVGIGVGGLFDFFSGNIERAPQWMRDIGMEWFYRFTRQPGRLWKRYFVGNFVFLLRVMRERFTSWTPGGRES